MGGTSTTEANTIITRRNSSTGMTEAGRTPKYNGSTRAKKGTAGTASCKDEGLRTPVSTRRIRAYFSRLVRCSEGRSGESLLLNLRWRSIGLNSSMEKSAGDCRFSRWKTCVRKEGTTHRCRPGYPQSEFMEPVPCRAVQVQRCPDFVGA